MACCKLCVAGLLAAGVLLLLTGLGFFNSYLLPTKPIVKDVFWGSGKPKADNLKLRPFAVSFSDSDYSNIKNRIKSFKPILPVEDSQFKFGFNGDFMTSVRKHWLEKYDWKKWLGVINGFQHFKTQIQGLDIHYIHAKPGKSAKVTIPIILIHGWPGSFFEFYKVIPFLTKSHDGVAFEVIVPSIPGYGFSEAPHKEGFDAIHCGRLFGTLMSRLGFDSKGYYVHGGDWGAAIGSAMVRYIDGPIRGYHSNSIIPPPLDPRYIAELMIGSLFPSLFFTKKDAGKVYPYFGKMKELLHESGYFHIQATKPDTVGHALSDSPVGVAAYILEKYSTWTNPKCRSFIDGCLVGEKARFELDELLTTVMIYLVSDSITSSMRFYRENIVAGTSFSILSLPSNIPFGAISFKYDVATAPERWVRYLYPNLLRYSDHDAGHFPGLEVPDFLSSEIRAFVRQAESFSSNSKKTKSEL